MADNKNTKSESKTVNQNRISKWWGALIGFPIVSVVIKEITEQIGRQGAENLTKRLGKVLGMGTEGAKRSVTDEILYAMALYSREAKLNPSEIEELDKFEILLRNCAKKDDKDSEGCLKAEAYVLYVANILDQLKKDIKEVTTPKKGTSGPKTESVYQDYSRGFDQAGRFFKELLKRDSFEKKVAFLEGKNVFSLISKKKEADPILEALKKFTGYSEDALKYGLKKIDPAGEWLAKQIEPRLYEIGPDKNPREDAQGKLIRKKETKADITKKWTWIAIKVAFILIVAAIVAYNCFYN
jgi:hypothetical protein